MQPWKLILDAFAILIMLACTAAMGLLSRVTRATGFAVVTLGLGWILATRVVVAVTDLIDEQLRYVVLPGYVFLFIGVTLTYASIRRYYHRKPQQPEEERRQTRRRQEDRERQGG